MGLKPRGLTVATYVITGLTHTHGQPSVTVSQTSVYIQASAGQTFSDHSAVSCYKQLCCSSSNFQRKSGRTRTCKKQKQTKKQRKTKPNQFKPNQNNSYWVSWCFEPSQPQRIILGQKTNLNLSPSYSAHKSLYHKSLILKPQLK